MVWDYLASSINGQSWDRSTVGNERPLAGKRKSIMIIDLNCLLGILTWRMVGGQTCGKGLCQKASSRCLLEAYFGLKPWNRAAMNKSDTIFMLYYTFLVKWI